MAIKGNEVVERLCYEDPATGQRAVHESDIPFYRSQERTLLSSNILIDSKSIDDYLAIERDRVELRQSYVDPFAEALPGRKLMRFYQIENKIDAVMRYELAASIPVIEQ